jgi:type IV secretion system protein VirB10
MEQPPTPTPAPQFPDVPPKPIKTIRWGLIAIGSLIALALIAQMVSHSGSATQGVAKNTSMMDKPQTTNQEQLEGFQRQQEMQQKQLIDAEKNASAALASMKGLEAQQADGLPAMTPQQKTAMGGGAQFRPATTTTAPEKKKHPGYESNTVAVDFSATQQDAKAPKGLTAPQFGYNAATDEGFAPESEQAIADAKPEPAEDKKPKYDFDSSTGAMYRVFEGTIIETVLTNRVNGAFVGPINCMVTTDIYSHDHQRLLVPQGTRIIGSVTAVGSTNQQRLFVGFHRMIMPDGYSVSLDKFIGLNVVGETGLRDLVNHHYLTIFGASLAIGAIGGLAQIGNGSSGFGYDPSVSLRSGISQQMAQESQQILNRFLNMLPTFQIRERTRVKVYISADLLLPAYEAHTVSPTL